MSVSERSEEEWVTVEDTDADIRSGIESPVPESLQPENPQHSSTTMDLFRIMENMMRAQSESFRKVIAEFAGKQKPIVQLIEFDPDKKQDAQAWVLTTELSVEREQLEGSDLLLALSRALKGRAAQWFTTNFNHHLTWTNFKFMFLKEFDAINTTASTMIEFMSSSIGKPEEYVSYITKMYSL
ncbi:hypothetical protein M8J75_014479 [Diaphorina citri]|nr:hypothetical protein M8J75_014479 [Diaphorina citri]